MNKRVEEMPQARWTRGVRLSIDKSMGEVNLSSIMPKVRKTIGDMMVTNQIIKDHKHLTKHFSDGTVVIAKSNYGIVSAHVTRPKRSEQRLYKSKTLYTPYGGVVFYSTKFELEIYEPASADPPFKVYSTLDRITEDKLYEDHPETPPKPAIHKVIPLLNSYVPSRRSAILFEKDYVSASTKTLPALQTLLTQTPAGPEYEALRLQIRELQALLSVAPRSNSYALKTVSQLATFVGGEGVPGFHSRYRNQVEPALQRTVAAEEVYDLKRLYKGTMFTGRMRQLIQYVQGLGTRDYLPNTVDDNGEDYCTYDFRTLQQAEGGEEWYAGVPTYRPMFDDCCGLYKSEMGRIYVINITSGGIWAMRLPVVRGTLDKLPEDMADWFKDVPLGIGFPRKSLTTDEAAWNAANPFSPQIKTPWAKAVEKGWVFQIQLDNLAEFYALGATYEECGWAFSYTGRKASNVGWRYNDAPPPHDHKIIEQWTINFTGGDESGPLYDYSHTDRGYDRSISTLAASMSMTDRGPACALVVNRQGEFKVPEPVNWKTGNLGVVSFDYTPEMHIWRPAKHPYTELSKTAPITDCVVHVFYDGEELIWSRLYFNPRPQPGTSEVTSSLTDSEFAGGGWPDWTIMCAEGGTGDYVNTPSQETVNGFYTKRHDPRQKPTESSGEWKARVLGTEKARFIKVQRVFPYLPVQFSCWSNLHDPEWFMTGAEPAGGDTAIEWLLVNVEVKGTDRGGESYAYGMTIPVTDREVTFIGERKSAGAKSEWRYTYSGEFCNYVYYVAPSWIPDMNDILLGPGHLQLGLGATYEDWQLRGDTVKYVMGKAFPPGTAPYAVCQKYGQLEQAVGTTLQPLDGGGFQWKTLTQESSSTSTPPTVTYAMHITQSETLKAYMSEPVPSHWESWQRYLPTDEADVQPPIPSAIFAATRSTLGAESEKVARGPDDGSKYIGPGSSGIPSNVRSITSIPTTFIGET